MKSLYETPDIEILLFDEEEILTKSGPPTEGYTASMDVNTQAETVMRGKSGSITTVRLEDVKVQ